MSNIYTLALRKAAERARADNHTQDEWFHYLRCSSPETVLALLDELEAMGVQIANLTAERDALREGEMGDAKHSNTRAAADIYFQLVEECEVPAGGSLVEYVSELRERAAMLQGADGNSPDGWVACSERMPEVGVKVLCFPVNDEPIHATYNGQVWLQDISWSTSDEPIDNVISCNVFHWMTLPAAPQQEVDYEVDK